MDALECIRQRRSIRAFAPGMPPRELIIECLEAASWAPNPTTQQPWEFIVLTGEALRRACSAIREHFSPLPDLPPETRSPSQEALGRRRQEHFSLMMSFLEAESYDLRAAAEGNFTFHGAPVGILFGTYPCKDQNFVKATAAAMQNFMLAAWSRGLGTCWMNAVSICQGHIRRELQLPDELLLVDGIAAGYPDTDAAVNRIPRDRLPAASFVRWLG